MSTCLLLCLWERAQIRKEFERKEQQIDVRKKIEYSTEVNAARMKILQAREEAVQVRKGRGGQARALLAIVAPRRR